LTPHVLTPSSSLFEPLLDHAAIAGAGAVADSGRTAAISGLTRPAKAVVAAALAHRLRRPVIVLTGDNEAADALRMTAGTILKWLDPEPADRSATLPAFDVSPYASLAPHAEIMERRAVALWNLARGHTRLLFVPLAAALGRFREPAYYRSLAVPLKTGDELSLNDLAEHLSGVGYEPSEPVTEVGQFSVRGGIVDFLPPEAAWPVRLEFFGDKIESIRWFDPATQRSRRTVENALLLPLSEIRRSPKFFTSLAARLVARAPHPAGERGGPDWAEAFSSPFPGWEFYAWVVEPHPRSVFSLAENPVILWDEPDERRRQLARLEEARPAEFDEVRDMTPPPLRPEELFMTAQEFEAALDTLGQIELEELSLSGGGSAPEVTEKPPAAAGRVTPAQSRFPLATQPVPRFHASIKAMAEEVRARLGGGERVVFAAPTTGTAERLAEIFSEYGIPFESHRAQAVKKTAPAASGDFSDGRVPAEDAPLAPAALGAAIEPVLVAPGEIEAGVIFPELALAFFSDRDIFGDFVWGATRRKDKSAVASFLSDLSDLKPGDFVVHIDHGIGCYQGLKRLQVEGRTRDFMLLTYQEDAKLYVSLERLDLVEKYRSSGDIAKPKLDRLGGSAWQHTKQRVRRALRDMAQELLKLYAERKMRGGAATSPDTAWQKEFEDLFPFEETPDQLTALEEIKRDLESPKPMDRLLCGDVGYGKTEVAMRAAFKVAQDNRQVAVLAPTTVLAFQHYNTFRLRFAAFPVRIEMLSRFRSAAEQKKILAEAEAGRVDILIGTHRLLSKDVKFHDLGLVVVDEEQRFGVAAKERLKSLRASVDVLTLSATPIPRTLHMALGGLRDLSVIESPPQGRLAIQTLVAPFSDGVVQSAILQEMERQGQVYFIHNRVESIFSVAAMVQRLVPTARIGVAHGQMSERELERVMLKFMEAKYDVLVATTLVENGLDIPRANTLVVNHAERFGLADLYQLRGRVGRSDRRAYAYFLVPAGDMLTPIARRRLAALKEFSDLGAGFRLAALDLELRGAGNILGAEQHGHLNAIGVDLYLKMLEEAVEQMKGEPVRPEVRITLNLGLDIKIPEDYIADERQRLRMYKRISTLTTPAARAEIEGELADRFGPIPPSVRNLLDYALLKARAEQMLIQSVERKGDELRLRFHEQTPVSLERLQALLRTRRGAALRPEGLLQIRLRDHPSLLDQVQNLLQELQL
jgi:transcription-repair coupling factor (superfamily II helicase)